jgi:hypothetical protein
LSFAVLHRRRTCPSWYAPVSPGPCGGLAELLRPQRAVDPAEVLVERLADVAVDAADDPLLVARLPLLRQVRIGQESARHADHVADAPVEHALGELQRADLARGDDGGEKAVRAQPRADGLGHPEVRAVRVVAAGHAAVPRVPGVRIERLAGDRARVLELAARAERDVVDPRARQTDGDRHGVDDRVTVADALLAEEAHADREVRPHALADPLDHAHRQAQAVLEGSAVGVPSRVEPRQERRQRVRVRHVQLDPVEAALASAHRGLAVRVDDPLDVVRRQHVDRLPPARARDLEEVDDLRDHAAGAGVVAPLAEIGQTRLELVGADAKERSALGLVHGHRLEDDHARAAPGEPHVALADVVVDDAVLARQARDHRREDDAVGQRHRADGQGGEEQAHVPSTSAPPMTSLWISLVPS